MSQQSDTPATCPVAKPTTVRSLLGRTNRDWWPQGLALDILNQGGLSADPMGDDFDYAEAFNAGKSGTNRNCSLPRSAACAWRT